MVAILLLSISGFPPLFSHTQDAGWTRQFGTDLDDRASGIAVDFTGVYVAGQVRGALPGQTSAGNMDTFVRKYDSSGNEIWTRQFGTDLDDGASGIAVDSTGVYVTGKMGGEAFVRKYDVSGNEVWTRRFGATGTVFPADIFVHSTGVYVAGKVNGALPGQTSAGGQYDVFIWKYDLSGNEVWIRQFGTDKEERATGIAVDSTGVYVAGITDGALPGQVGMGSSDAFVRKYDPSGNEVWTRQWGTPERDEASAIAVDASGVYVAGITDGALPGQVGMGSSDAFVRKYDPSGNEVWTRQWGTPERDEASAIAVDASGVHVAGYTEGAFPGQVNTDHAPIFVRKYDFLDR